MQDPACWSWRRRDFGSMLPVRRYVYVEIQCKMVVMGWMLVLCLCVCLCKLCGRATP